MRRMKLDDPDINELKCAIGNLKIEDFSSREVFGTRVDLILIDLLKEVTSLVPSVAFRAAAMEELLARDETNYDWTAVASSTTRRACFLTESAVKEAADWIYSIWHNDGTPLEMPEGELAHFVGFVVDDLFREILEAVTASIPNEDDRENVVQFLMDRELFEYQNNDE